MSQQVFRSFYAFSQVAQDRLFHSYFLFKVPWTYPTRELSSQCCAAETWLWHAHSRQLSGASCSGLISSAAATRHHKGHPTSPWFLGSWPGQLLLKSSGAWVERWPGYVEQPGPAGSVAAH